MNQNDKTDFLEPDGFLFLCMQAFHLTSQREGYVPKGIIANHELQQIGDRIVPGILADKSFKSLLRSQNEATYYFVIFTLCFEAGAVFAREWDSGDVDEDFVNKVFRKGPPAFAEPILKQYYGFEKMDINVFASKSYDMFRTFVEPYDTVPNREEYYEMGMKAAFQLGVSMILYKLGY